MDDGNFKARSFGKFSNWAEVTFFLFGLAFWSNALEPLIWQTNLAAVMALFVLFAVAMLPCHPKTNRFGDGIDGFAGITRVGLLVKPTEFSTLIFCLNLIGGHKYNAKRIQ